MTRTIVLDNEAVQALMSTKHRKHRRALAHAQVVATRKRRARTVKLVVPTAVRVEAGWDRTHPRDALINRLRIGDAPLDTPQANVAAALVDRYDIAVADAHLGATIHTAPTADPVTVITSDPTDIRHVTSGRSTVIVAL